MTNCNIVRLVSHVIVTYRANCRSVARSRFTPVSGHARLPVYVRLSHFRSDTTSPAIVPPAIGKSRPEIKFRLRFWSEIAWLTMHVVVGMGGGALTLRCHRLRQQNRVYFVVVAS